MSGDPVIQSYALHRYAEERLTKAWLACTRLMQKEFPFREVEQMIGDKNAIGVEPIVEKLAKTAAHRFNEFRKDEYHRAMIIERQNADPVVRQHGVLEKAEVKVEYGRYGLTNPVAVMAHLINDQKFITQITNEQRRTFQSVLTDGALLGRNPRASAIRIRDSLGLTDHQEQIISNYRKELERFRPKFNPRKLRDRRYDNTIIRAIESNTALDPEKVDKMVGRYRERWLKHRSEMIARTESLRAVRGGQVGMWQDLMDRGFLDPDSVRAFWIVTRDGRQRDSHDETPGLNPNGRKIGEAFVTGRGNMLRYPGDEDCTDAADIINCRCITMIKPVGAITGDEPESVKINVNQLPERMAGVDAAARASIADVMNRRSHPRVAHINYLREGIEEGLFILAYKAESILEAVRLKRKPDLAVLERLLERGRRLILPDGVGDPVPLLEVSAYVGLPALELGSGVMTRDGSYLPRR